MFGIDVKDKFKLTNRFRLVKRRHFVDNSVFDRCEIDNKCLTLGDPPAEGTICGPHKWCQLGVCVGMDDHHNPKIHGQWGHWSEWGPCSR